MNDLDNKDYYDNSNNASPGMSIQICSDENDVQPTLDTQILKYNNKLDIIEKPCTSKGIKSIEFSIDNLDPDKFGADENCVNYKMNTYSKFFMVNRINKKKSEMYLCQNIFDRKYYIIKSVYNDRDFLLSKESKKILNEIRILKSIRLHVNVIRFIHSWTEGDKLHLLLEYVGGGSLYDFLVGNREILPVENVNNSRVHNISVSSAFVLLAQISSALIYMHDYLKIFHGGIKPSNILVDLIKYSTDNIFQAKEECHKILLDPLPNPRLRFKLCDFRKSGRADNVMKIKCGYERYLPPLSDFHSPSHSMATSRDVLSLALTIYECLGGTLKESKWESWPENVTDDMRSIIQRMDFNNENLREIIKIKQIRDLILPEAWELLQKELPSP